MGGECSKHGCEVGWGYGGVTGFITLARNHANTHCTLAFHKMLSNCQTPDIGVMIHCCTQSCSHGDVIMFLAGKRASMLLQKILDKGELIVERKNWTCHVNKKHVKLSCGWLKTRVNTTLVCKYIKDNGRTTCFSPGQSIKNVVKTSLVYRIQTYGKRAGGGEESENKYCPLFT